MVLRNVAKTFSLEEQRQEINEIAVDLDAVNTTLTNWNAANWDTAYGWGDHGTVGYLTAEADTLDTVTGRGGTTTNTIQVGQINIGTGSTEINAQGNATFAGILESSLLVNTNNTPTAGEGIEMFYDASASGGAAGGIQAYDRDGAALTRLKIKSSNWQIENDGAATFNGNTTVGAPDVTNGSTGGVQVFASGQLRIQRDSAGTASDKRFQMYYGTAETASITAAGAATFEQGLSVGYGTSSASTVITRWRSDVVSPNSTVASVNADGSAQFNETVSIGSGSAAPDDYGLIAYANANTLSNKSAVYARNLADGRNFTGDNAAGATTFELYASGLGNFGVASNSTGHNGVAVGGNNGSLNIYTDRYATDCFQILNTSGSGTNIALQAFGNGNLSVAGNISVTGTVDGRDIATDGATLDSLSPGGTFSGAGTNADPAIGSIQFKNTGNTFGGDSLFTYDNTNNKLSVGVNTGNAALNVVRPGTTSVDTAYFYASDSGADNRILINTVANQGGNPFIRFDSGGSNMVIGQLWAGTTNNKLVLGTGETPSGVTGIAIDGLGNVTANNLALSQTNTTVTGASASSTVLDHYEEGTWTPQWGSTTGAITNVTYNVQSGWYTRIGRVVYVHCRLRSTATCLLYTSPSPRDATLSRMPSSA